MISLLCPAWIGERISLAADNNSVTLSVRKLLRLRLSWGSFSLSQTGCRRCRRTCPGWRSGLDWPADSPPTVSRLARNIVVLCSPWWRSGERPALEGGAAACPHWETRDGTAGCWAAQLAAGSACGWKQEGRCIGLGGGRVPSALVWSVWDNHKGPS